jgi:hypothetical protein
MSGATYIIYILTKYYLYSYISMSILFESYKFSSDNSISIILKIFDLRQL